jgi:hypothetical protein
VLVESMLAGDSVERLLDQGDIDPGDLQERLADWLLRWARSEASPRVLDRGDLDRLLLSPAKRLAGGSRPYLDFLEKLCARAVGASCSFVPTHGDLTAANIVVNGSGGLGIYDWEDATMEGLPLTDFFYATADVVAAVRGYADRPGAVVSCFAADGARAQHVRRLVDGFAGALELDAVVREVCFHACWLQHASNEAVRGADSSAKPFGAILSALAEEPARFRP